MCFSVRKLKTWADSRGLRYWEVERGAMWCFCGVSPCSNLFNYFVVSQRPSLCAHLRWFTWNVFFCWVNCRGIARGARVDGWMDRRRHIPCWSGSTPKCLSDIFKLSLGAGLAPLSPQNTRKSGCNSLGYHMVYTKGRGSTCSAEVLCAPLAGGLCFPDGIPVAWSPEQ